jgi:hypothetical protein
MTIINRTSVALFLISEWIEISTHFYADLFVNKLAYMTNSTSI